MKTLTYKQSKISDNILGIKVYTYYINLSDKHPTYFYTIKVSEEMFTHFINISKQAGYTIIDDKEN